MLRSLLIFFAFLLTCPLLAVTATWTGAISTNWANPGNWSTGAVPGSSDEVVINSGTAIIKSGGFYSVSLVTVGTNGKLVVKGGGQLTVRSTAAVTAVTNNGRIICHGNLLVDGGNTTTLGIKNNVGGLIRISAASYSYLERCDLAIDNEGQINHFGFLSVEDISGGQYCISNEGTWYNKPSAQLWLSNNTPTSSWLSNVGAFNNEGGLTMETNFDTPNFVTHGSPVGGATFYNSGTIELTNNGATVVTTDALSVFNDFENEGDILIHANSDQIGVSLHTGGVLTNQDGGTIEVSGDLTYGYYLFLNGRLENHGDLIVDNTGSYGLYIYDGAELANHPDGRLRVSGDLAYGVTLSYAGQLDNTGGFVNIKSGSSYAFNFIDDGYLHNFNCGTIQTVSPMRISADPVTSFLNEAWWEVPDFSGIQDFGTTANAVINEGLILDPTDMIGSATGIGFANFGTIIGTSAVYTGGVIQEDFSLPGCDSKHYPFDGSVYGLPGTSSLALAPPSGVITAEQQRTAWQVEVFPNPARSTFTVQLPTDNVHPFSVRLYNALGQLVLSEKATTSVLSVVRPASLGAGVYTLEVDDRFGKQQVKRVVLE